MAVTKPTQGFLSFNSGPARIYLTTSAPHPPEKALIAWKEEGYEVTFLPYTPQNRLEYTRTLKRLHDNLNLGEVYGVVAYGEAADVVLQVALKPMPRCGSIVAYYPTTLPSAQHRYPESLHVIIHVSGDQASPRPELCEWRCYRYENARVGFADPTSTSYQDVEANLAWSRSLANTRKGFKKEVDLEPIVQEVWKGKYEIDDPVQGGLKVAKSYSQNSTPHVTILPTLEGAVGRKKLLEFYREFFIPSLVEDFRIRLVSRTVGVDRVVDEMVVSFTHNDEVDWILPGVKPTNKRVEVAIVSIVAIRGGKLVSEHMYWDQASVLAQVGLIDPKVVPKRFRDQGLKRLPVAGVEAARQLQDPKQERYNGLLRDHGLLSGLNLGLNGANGVDGL